MSEQTYEDWTGEMGDRWLGSLDRFESMIAPVGAALVAHAGFRAGESVVDVGCGGGVNSFDIAQAVGPQGRVLGFDIAPQLIAHAQARLAKRPMDNLSFAAGDAQTATPPGAPYDRLFSRFGVMFFENTRDAFENMRGWIAPGGRADFACWAGPDRNPWIAMMREIFSRFVEMPPPDPDAPGPMRLADPDATKAMLEAAGYRDVSLELWEGELFLGGAGADPDSAAEFVLSGMGMAAMLDEAPEGTKDKARAAIVEALTPHYRDGSVRMANAAWFVSATA